MIARCIATEGPSLRLIVMRLFILYMFAWIYMQGPQTYMQEAGDTIALHFRPKDG